jgi:hypothetical protein
LLEEGTLEALVQTTADRITEMAKQTLGANPSGQSANGDISAPRNYERVTVSEN